MILIVILILTIYLLLFCNTLEYMTDKFYYAGADLNFNIDPSSKSYYYINIKDNSIDVPDADILVKKDLYDYKTHYSNMKYNYFGLS